MPNVVGAATQGPDRSDALVLWRRSPYDQPVNTVGIEMLKRAVAVLAVLMAALAAGPAVAAPADPGAADRADISAEDGADISADLGSGQGITVESVERASEREYHLVVSTTALAQPVRLNLLLPHGYGEGRQRYASLYLLHGTSGGADDWIELGDAVAATASLPAVVVIPDGGYAGGGGSWWNDWVDQGTALGAADWETFHIDQLVPWVDAHLLTIATRGQRAIAGLSQGGFGSFSYAARHPDIFGAAASFSGAPDIAEDPVCRTGGGFIVGAIMTGLNQVQPFAPFGDPVLEAINWRGHNPASLVTNLADTDLAMWAGNGTPGPLDPPPGVDNVGGPDAIEILTHRSALCFAAAADAAGVDYRLTDYGPGTHRWAYWARDFVEWLPELSRFYGEHRTLPRLVGYTSIDPVWSQWGWRVALDRDAEQAFSALTGAGVHGFTFTGGDARVRTPSAYRPGSRHLVRVAGSPARLRADGRGRLVVAVSAPDATTPVEVRIGR